ncbi:LacI family DNA-binding transcriptional regulator [Streptomyces aculeolatus]
MRGAHEDGRHAAARTGPPEAREPAPRSAAGRGGGVTSRDVARAAGVSQAAVSLVLGDKWRGRVAAAKAGAVRDAARCLDYRPNAAARTLRTGGTRTALLVVPALTNEFFAGVHAGAARAAAAHDFGVVLYPSPEGIGPARDPFAAAHTAVDGVIASSMATDAVRALRAGGLPLVMLDSDPADAGAVATVNADVADGMRQVARHLLELGHRRITHLAAAIDSWTFTARGRALADALIAVPGARLRTEPAELSVARALAAAQRARAGPAAARTTALVCDDDLLAAGALKAVRRLGLRVPYDVSVTGFDDLALATAVEPELTTVRLPAGTVGAAGMTALLDAVAGRGAESTTVPARLTVRTSTAPAPDAQRR